MKFDDSRDDSTLDFREQWMLAKEDLEYVRLKAEHRAIHDPPSSRKRPKP